MWSRTAPGYRQDIQTDIQCSKITGTGWHGQRSLRGYAECKQDAFTAAAGGVMSMGIAGEIAYEKAGPRGNRQLARGTDGMHCPC